MVSQVVAKAMGKILGRLPVRLNVGVMIFLSCMTSYMLRVNFSIAILAMVVPSSPSLLNGTDITGVLTVKDYGPRYHWSSSQQGLLLGSYFWGYLISALPGTWLVEKYGGKILITTSFALSVVVTALAPLFASWGFYAMYISRFITGFLSGPHYAAFHNIISKWAPPEEKGKFMGSLMGGTFGTVITLPIVGLLIENVSWATGFYIPAVVTGIICLLWHLIVADKPNVHSFIKPEEKDYIEKALGTSVSKEKPKPPIRQILTSIPFIALVILHFSNLWGLFFLMTAAPKFMNVVLNFNLSQSGFLSALPYLARLTCGILFGYIGDFVRNRKWLSVTNIRKVFTIFSHILPGLFLALLCFITEPYACVAVITASLGFNGAVSITNLQNSHDLAPNFAGLLYGIMNFVGTTPGFISPIIVSYFTEDGNTMAEWSNVFIVGCVIYVLPALIYMMLGSGETQPWNEPLPEGEKNKDKQQNSSEKTA
ncbi:sialin-like [Phlebotomus papatasi]|uniref:sialin-like n=1 Tax=Phlebotomus papatasi TaxID=29031 RepID=UPI002483773B|nr:sialin-like [Phlebotomus papatasi]